MSPEIHTCIICGKDTTSRGQICRSCLIEIEPEYIEDDRDEYEREIDEMLGLDRYEESGDE